MHPGADDDEDMIGLGSDDPREPWWTSRRRALAGAVVLAVAGAAAVIAVTSHARPGGPGDAHPGNAARPGHPAAGPTSLTVPPGALLGAGERGDWELDVLGGQAADLSAGPMLVRIRFGPGTVTQVALGPLGGTGPAQVMAGPGQVIIRPLDAEPGYTVPDGKAARGTAASLGKGGVMYPGPRAGQFWVTAGSGTSPALRLVSASGENASQAIRLPAGPANFVTTVADGHGYVLVQDQGAVYDARPPGWRKVADGTLIAAGAAGWLIGQCQGTSHCRDTVVNPVTGARRVLPGSADLVSPGGAIPSGAVSPDGTLAAVLVPDEGKGTTLRLIDLRTGVARPTSAGPGGVALDGFAWSPDGRWLFFAPGDGTLDAVDSRSGQVRDLGVSLPPVMALTVRGD